MRLGIIFILTSIFLVTAAWFLRDSFKNQRDIGTYRPAQSGVIFYDHLRADDSNYLMLNWYADSVFTCKILNYYGKEIYNFPNGFCRFTENGELYLAAAVVTKFDKNGDQEWARSEYIPHHAVDYSEESKEFFFVNLEDDGVHQSSDSVIGLDANGKEIFKWVAKDHYPELVAILERPLYVVKNPNPKRNLESTHLNTVLVLPPNVNEDHLPAFHRGNILVNCFNQSLIFIIDRKTQKIVWHHILTNGDRQPNGARQKFNGAHTVQLLPNGHLFYFWNKRIRSTLMFSSINELDPVSNQMTWEYVNDSPTSFYVDLWGAAYPIGESQVLVSDTIGGTVFQIDRQGRILWQWQAPLQKDNKNPMHPYQVIPVSKALLDPIIDRWKARELNGG